MRGSRGGGGGARPRGGYRGGYSGGSSSYHGSSSAAVGSKRGRYGDECISDEETEQEQRMKNSYMGRMKLLFVSMGDKGSFDRHISQLSKALIEDLPREFSVDGDVSAVSAVSTNESEKNDENEKVQKAHDGENGEKSSEKSSEKPQDEKQQKAAKVISDVVTVILDSVHHVPGKIPVYGTVTGLVALERKFLVQFLLRELNERLVQSAKANDWRACKVWCKFACELMNVNLIEPSDIIRLYEPFVEQVTSSLNSGACQLMTDSFVYVILGSVMHGLGKLSESCSQQLTDMLNAVGRYMYMRAKCLYKRDYASFSHVFCQDDKSQQSMMDDVGSWDFKKDYLQVMWETISNTNLPEIDDEDEEEEDDVSMASSNYEELAVSSIVHSSSVHRLISYRKNFEDQLSQNQPQSFQFNLPLVSSGTTGKRTKVYAGRLGLFEMVALSGDMPPPLVNLISSDLPSKMDRLMINEILSDHLHVNHLDTQRLKVQRLVVDIVVNHLKSHSSGDEQAGKMEDDNNGGGGSSWNSDGSEQVVSQKANVIAQCLLADSILGHLFILPSSPLRAQYYHSLVSELTISDKDQTTASHNKSIFDLFIQKCFDLLPFMDMECVTSRFASFFASYLHGHRLRWDWESWSHHLSVDGEHHYTTKLRREFIKQTLHTLSRLSPNGVSDVNRCIRNKSVTGASAPYDFLQDLTPTTDHHSAPFFKYSEDNMTTENMDQSLKTVARDVLDAFKNQIKPKDLSQLIQRHVDGGMNSTDLVDIFMHSIMSLSTQSVTQLHNYIDLYGECILAVSTSGIQMDAKIEIQRAIVRSVCEFWRGSVQFASTALQKLLVASGEKSLINLQSVVSCLFTSPSPSSSSQSLWTFGDDHQYSWSIVKACFEAVLARGVFALESGRSTMAQSAVFELQESILMATQRIVQFLFSTEGTIGNDDEWTYRTTVSHLTELVRCWQQFAPFTALNSVVQSTVERSCQTEGDQGHAQQVKRLVVHKLVKLAQYSQSWETKNAESTMPKNTLLQYVVAHHENDETRLNSIVQALNEQTHVYLVHNSTNN